MKQTTRQSELVRADTTMAGISQPGAPNSAHWLSAISSMSAFRSGKSSERFAKLSLVTDPRTHATIQDVLQSLSAHPCATVTPPTPKFRVPEVLASLLPCWLRNPGHFTRRMGMVCQEICSSVLFEDSVTSQCFSPKTPQGPTHVATLL